MCDKKNYEQAIEELSLMLMYLTREQDNNEFCRYRELSWKGYDFGTLDRLSGEELIFQPRGSRGYEKYLYLTEQDAKRRRRFLQSTAYVTRHSMNGFCFAIFCRRRQSRRRKLSRYVSRRTRRAQNLRLLSAWQQHRSFFSSR